MLRQRVPVRYAFTRDQSTEYPVRSLCRMMRVHPCGYYAWLHHPKSKRQIEDARFLGLIKQFLLESGCVYGYRKISKDLREVGESCGKYRVHRLMQQEGIKAQVGCREPCSESWKI